MTSVWSQLIPKIATIPLDPDDKLTVVQYWDHCDQTVVAVSSHLGVSAIPSSGGDEPEAVFDGLAAAGNLPWRPEAERFAVLIGDAGPHWYYSKGAYGFPEESSPHCKCGLTLRGIAELFAYNQIKLFTHVTRNVSFYNGEGSIPTYEAFKDIAEACAGTFIATLEEIPLFKNGS
jgi:hypothetical protein